MQLEGKWETCTRRCSAVTIPEGETITITDWDLADVVDNEDAMRDEDAPRLGGTETHTTKEVQKDHAEGGSG